MYFFEFFIYFLTCRIMKIEFEKCIITQIIRLLIIFYDMLLEDRTKSIRYIRVPSSWPCNTSISCANSSCSHSIINRFIFWLGNFEVFCYQINIQLLKRRHADMFFHCGTFPKKSVTCTYVTVPVLHYYYRYTSILHPSARGGESSEKVFFICHPFQYTTTRHPQSAVFW